MSKKVKTTKTRDPHVEVVRGLFDEAIRRPRRLRVDPARGFRVDSAIKDEPRLVRVVYALWVCIFHVDEAPQIAAWLANGGTFRDELPVPEDLARRSPDYRISARASAILSAIVRGALAPTPRRKGAARSSPADRSHRRRAR